MSRDYLEIPAALLEAETTPSPDEVTLRLVEAALGTQERPWSPVEAADAFLDVQAYLENRGETDPPIVNPVDPDPTAVEVVHVKDLSKQTEVAVELPWEDYRLTWDYDTAEPKQTGKTITLTVLEVHDGTAWSDRRRMVVTARRKAGESKWSLLAGIGTGAAGGSTTWSTRVLANPKRLTFDQVVKGTLTVDDALELDGDGYGKSAVLGPGTHVPHGRWTLQVGHKDGRRGEAGAGDEPFGPGTGEVTIATVQADGPPDVDVDALLDAMDRPTKKVSGGVSGMEFMPYLWSTYVSILNGGSVPPWPGMNGSDDARHRYIAGQVALKCIEKPVIATRAHWERRRLLGLRVTDAELDAFFGTEDTVQDGRWDGDRYIIGGDDYAGQAEWIKERDTAQAVADSLTKEEIRRVPDVIWVLLFKNAPRLAGYIAELAEFAILPGRESGRAHDAAAKFLADVAERRAR